MCRRDLARAGSAKRPGRPVGGLSLGVRAKPLADGGIPVSPRSLDQLQDYGWPDARQGQAEIPKKHNRLKWSGRGMLPIWMREEMKGTKLTKQDFAIK